MVSEEDKGYVDKTISLKALYRYQYGFLGNELGSPFETVAYLPSMKGDSLDIMEGMIKRFIKFKVVERSGLDIDQFFNRPPYITKMIFDHCEELYRKESSENEEETREIKKLNNDITNNV